MTTINKKPIQVIPFEVQLRSLEYAIDKIDKKILELLKNRVGIAEEIAEIKIQNNKSIIDREREAGITQKLLKLNKNENKKALSSELEEEFLLELWGAILDYSRQKQGKKAVDNMRIL